MAMIVRILTGILLAGVTLWAALALWFQLPFGETERLMLAGAMGFLGVLTMIAQFTPARRLALLGFAVVLAGIALWWSSLTPPAQGNWSPDVARQVTGEIDGDILTLRDVRNFTWRTPEDFTAHWDTRTYDLSRLTTLDMFMSYWSGPAIAHMVVSFGFENGDHIAWSVEVRRTKDSLYSPLADAFRTHTLVLIAADERDVIGTRTNARGEDVQLYRLNTPPQTARALLEQYVAQANALAAQPSFYNSLTHNCTTQVIAMIRAVTGETPMDWRILANGYLPELAYDRGVLGTELPIEALRQASRITDKAQAAGITPAYSQMIRDGVPSPAG